jgi:hypothetical protein
MRAKGGWLPPPVRYVSFPKRELDLSIKADANTIIFCF